MSGPASREREILWTGIGGQGVQLAAKILALAATREGREVLSLGTYGGTMRGGNTDATVVIGDGRLASPPMVARAWAAVVVHPRYFEPLRAKIRPDGLVLADADLLEGPIGGLAAAVLDIPATKLAQEAEAPKSAALVLLGAFAHTTGIVSPESLEEALAEALPPYRQDSLEANRRALAAGRSALPSLEYPAWASEAA